MATFTVFYRDTASHDQIYAVVWDAPTVALTTHSGIPHEMLTERIAKLCSYTNAECVRLSQSLEYITHIGAGQAIAIQTHLHCDVEAYGDNG